MFIETWKRKVVWNGGNYGRIKLELGDCVVIVGKS